MPHFHQENVSRANRGAELPFHTSAMMQCEPTLHFCQDEVHRTQDESDTFPMHIHIPSAHAKPQQGNCLLKNKIK